MKKVTKVVLWVLLAVLCLGVASGIASAWGEYRVWIDKAYVDYLVLVRPADYPCDMYKPGYGVSIGHGTTCTSCLSGQNPFWMNVPRLTERKRLQRWFPMLGPWPWETACIAWSCHTGPPSWIIYWGWDCEPIRSH